MKDRIYNFLKHSLTTHKTFYAVAAAFLVLAASVTTAIVITKGKKDHSVSVQSTGTSSVYAEPLMSEEASSEETVSPEAAVSSKETLSKTESVVSKINTSDGKNTSKKPVTSKPVINNTDYKYNTNIDIDNNVFLDALVYTGYNLEKHRADGLMWQYVLASQKRGKGWLSNIGYGGGSTGYEAKNGKPDIKAFERGGLVCASYVTYVYFNYLPNVAGIDTSSLTRPNKSYSANDWYIAASDWVKKGYSKTISFKASKTSAGFINFKASEEIPIGSIMAFSDAKKPGSTHCSHVAVYAGYKNGYNWVFHVGNKNGPEFCAVERMYFGPDPQWPLAVITTPSNIRMSALLEVSVKDENGVALSGVKFNLKNTKTGAVKYLGTSDKNGKLSVGSLSYGDYILIQTVPAGYTCANASQNIKLTTANNSYNKVSFTDTKIPPPMPEPEPEPDPVPNPEPDPGESSQPQNENSQES